MPDTNSDMNEQQVQTQTDNEIDSDLETLCKRVEAINTTLSSKEVELQIEVWNTLLDVYRGSIQDFWRTKSERFKSFWNSNNSNAPNLNNVAVGNNTEGDVEDIRMALVLTAYEDLLSSVELSKSLEPFIEIACPEFEIVKNGLLLRNDTVLEQKALALIVDLFTALNNYSENSPPLIDFANFFANLSEANDTRLQLQPKAIASMKVLRSLLLSQFVASLCLVFAAIM